jgi:hypothetical protein
MLHFAKPTRIYPPEPACIYSPEPNRVYPPETVAVMTAAFDRVCQSLSTRINGNKDVKQALALIILRHVDNGERNPERLTEIAFRESRHFSFRQRDELSGPWRGYQKKTWGPMSL